jgi:hypothetical protein
MQKLSYGAMYTPTDLDHLAHGHLDEPEAAQAMRTPRRGMRPDQQAALTAAVQTSRILSLIDVEKELTEPTQADRIEALLTKVVTLLERQDSRLSEIERQLGRR